MLGGRVEIRSLIPNQPSIFRSDLRRRRSPENQSKFQQRIVGPVPTGRQKLVASHLNESSHSYPRLPRLFALVRVVFLLESLLPYMSHLQLLVERSAPIDTREDRLGGQRSRSFETPDPVEQRVMPRKPDCFQDLTMITSQKSSFCGQVSWLLSLHRWLW